MIKLVNANGAALGTSTYTHTIVDNDAAPTPTVGFAASSLRAALESLSPATIVGLLSAAQPSP